MRATGAGWGCEVTIENLLSVIGFVAKHSPSIAEWLTKLAEGETSHADQLRAVLPFDSKSGAAARWMKDDKAE